MAKKRAAKRKSANNNTTVENDENLEETNSVENGVDGSSKPTASKKKKSVTTKAEQKNGTPKTKPKASKSKSDEEEEEEDDVDYEVEKILDIKKKKNGKREFLVRWKNYSAEHDTWEPEENLSCHELITKFLESQEQDEEEKEQDYEVEKILDVNYKKNGKREFLIRWKNFSAKHDTWEPEDNLSCDELITKFLEVQEQREKQPRKDLRERPKTVSRYSAAAGGRKSKRTAGTKKSYTEQEDDDDE